MKTVVAFWSEQQEKDDVCRTNGGVKVKSVVHMKRLVTKYGAPNAVVFVDLKKTRMLYEGRDWTRRERENVPECLDQLYEAIGRNN